MAAEGEGAALHKLEMQKFDDWMRARSISAVDVAHATFAIGGGQQRGVVAERDLVDGEAIIEVPRDSALCLLRGEKAPVADLAEFWDAHPQWYVRLGTKLLLEKDKGSASSIRCFDI